MAYKSREYSDEEAAKLEALKNTKVLELSISGDYISSVYQEQFQRDPSVDELSDMISCIVDSDIQDVVAKHAGEYISAILNSIFDVECGRS